MTLSRIQHILSGIKSEIAREGDRERVRQLCIMGMHWTKELMMYIPEVIVEPGERKYQVCHVCHIMLPLKYFSKFTIDGGELYYRLDCKKCAATRARKVYKKKVNIFSYPIPKVRSNNDI